MSIGTSQRKILILASNPTSTSPLRLDQEVRDIHEALHRARQRDHFILEQQWAVRPRDVQRAILDVEPHIVHFSGHGAGQEGLVLENEVGQAKFVEAEALAGLFELFTDQIECVILNACYSEVQAEAIVRHIPYVIGMNQPIGDRAAIEFAVGFYDALGAGRSIEFAFRFGCSAIQMAGVSDFETPNLKKNSNSITPDLTNQTSDPIDQQTIDNKQKPQVEEAIEQTEDDLPPVEPLVPENEDLSHSEQAIEQTEYDLSTIGSLTPADVEEQMQDENSRSNPSNGAQLSEIPSQGNASIEIAPVPDLPAQAPDLIAQEDAENEQRPQVEQAIEQEDEELSHPEQTIEQAEDNHLPLVEPPVLADVEEQGRDEECRSNPSNGAQPFEIPSQESEPIETAPPPDPSIQTESNGQPSTSTNGEIRPKPWISQWTIVGLFLVLAAGIGGIAIALDPVKLPNNPCNPPIADDVADLDFSPDGEYIATGSYDNTVRVFEVTNSGSEPEPIDCEESTNGVVAVQFSSEGTYLATASMDSAQLWKVDDNGGITSLPRPLKHGTLQPDGSTVHNNPVVAMDFSQDEAHLVTASSDGSVKVWDVNNLAEPVKTLKRGTYARTVRFSSNGKYIAMTSLNDRALVWEWETDSRNEIPQTPGTITDIMFNPENENVFATASTDGTIQIWNITNLRKPVATLKHDTYVTAIRFSSNGRYVAALSLDKKLYMWNLDNQTKVIPPTRLQKDTANVVAFAFSSDSQHLATNSADGLMRVWNTADGSKARDQWHVGRLAAVAFNPDNEEYLTIASPNGTIQIEKWR